MAQSDFVKAVADWPAGRVLLTWVPHPQPYAKPVTAANCFCILGSKVLVVHVNQRGLCIPGGHLEPEESPKEALLREILEESCVSAESLNLLGAVQVDHSINPCFIEGGRYPKLASQLMYVGRVAEVHPFRSQHETISRRFVAAAELPSVHHEWNTVLQAAFERALARTYSTEETT